MCKYGTFYEMKGITFKITLGEDVMSKVQTHLCDCC
jgi:hypothetical protein